MAEQEENTLRAKAWVFFERAAKVAQTNNFDYAIDLYLEGLRCAPDELQQGHIRLHQLALKRQVNGGKKPTMMEKVKRSRAKDPLDQLINAEYLFAKDPDKLTYAEDILKAATAGGYRNAAKWIGDLIFGANNAASKPSFQTYILLKDSYAAIGEFDRALMACDHATKLKPEDGELADEFKRLSAELTVAKGKYDQDGDFRDSIKDRESQEERQSQLRTVKTKDYRVSTVEKARKELANNPDLSKNIFNLATALSELQDEKSDNEAIGLLDNAYKQKNDFSYKQHAGLIKNNQAKRNLRHAKDALKKNAADPQAKARVLELTTLLNNIEMEHYQLCTANYPTDMRVKYEYGLRLLRNKQYDDAIPLFQEAQHEPRHKIPAMDKIGLCFFRKGWYADAIDVYTQAIELYEASDDSTAKELRYNLARSYEEQGDKEKALDIYRKIAQLDFAYKDVRQRVDSLRKNNG